MRYRQEGLTRREFILTAGASVTTVFLPSCSRRPKVDLEKKLSDIVQVTKPGYRCEQIVDGLIYPENVTINPVNNSIFFTQSNLYRFSGKYDLTDTKVMDRLLDEKGHDLDVFEFVGGKPVWRFRGTRSPHTAQHKSIEIKINSRDEIFIYAGPQTDDNEASFFDKTLSVYDLKTGELKTCIKDRRIYSRVMAVNPLDGRLYLCIDETDRSRYDPLARSIFSLYYLDTEKKSLVRWFKKGGEADLYIDSKGNVSQYYLDTEKGGEGDLFFDSKGNLCFDSEGNLYVVRPSHPHKHPDRADTWSDNFEVTRISPNKDIDRFEIDTHVTIPREGVFSDADYIGFDNFSDKLIFAGMCRYDYFSDGILLSVDPKRQEQTPEERAFKSIEKKKFETIAWLEHWLRGGKEFGGAGDIKSYGVSGLDVSKGEYYVSIDFGFSFRQCSSHGRIFKLTQG